MPSFGVVDVTINSDEEGSTVASDLEFLEDPTLAGALSPQQDARIVDVTGESGDDDVAEEVPAGGPPLRFHGYRRGRELGRGASGQVFLCKKRGYPGGFAVKAVDLRKLRLSLHVEREQKKLRREVDILKGLPPHPHVVSLVDAYEEGDWFLLVLELMGGGDLYTVLTARSPPRLQECEAAFVLRQLVGGLSFLHSQGVIHRDLKLENVLVASERRVGDGIFYVVRITDFGLSKALGAGRSEARSTVGTQPYVAPEVMKTDAYDFGADIWCLGVLLYVLLAGQFPCERMVEDQALLDILPGKLRVNETAKAVLRGLLQLEPTKRFTVEELSKHAWLQQDVGGLEEDVLRPSKQARQETMTAPPATPIPSFEAEAPLEEDLELEPEAPVPLLSEVRPASAQQDVMQLHVVIPNRVAAAMLENDSMCIEQVATTAGCQVFMTSAREGAETRRAVVIGKYSECAAAQEMLHKYLAESTLQSEAASREYFEVVLLVRAEAAGVVNGKQGFCLQQIRQQSGAQIQLLRDEVAGQRPCILAGELRPILQAEKHIFDLVRAVSIAGTHIDSTVGTGPLNDCGAAAAASAAAAAEAAAAAAVTTRVLIPSGLAGAVIGKQGSGLRQIREQCGVKVQVLRAHQWPGESILLLRGPVACRQAAIEMVLRATMVVDGQEEANSTEQCKLRLALPATQAARITVGSALQQLREHCNDLSVELGPAGDFGGERLLSMSGSCGQLLDAAAMVFEALGGRGALQQPLVDACAK